MMKPQLKHQYQPIKGSTPKEVIHTRNEKSTNWYNPPDDVLDNPSDTRSNCKNPRKIHDNCCCPSQGPKGDRGEKGEAGVSESKIVFGSDINHIIYNEINYDPPAPPTAPTPPLYAVLIGAIGNLNNSADPNITRCTLSAVPGTSTSMVNPPPGISSAILGSYSFVIPEIGYIKDIELNINADFTGVIPVSGSMPNIITYYSYVYKSTSLITGGIVYLNNGYIVQPNLGTSVSFTFGNGGTVTEEAMYSGNNFSHGNPPVQVSRGDQIGVVIYATDSSTGYLIPSRSVESYATSASVTLTFVAR